MLAGVGVLLAGASPALAGTICRAGVCVTVSDQTAQSFANSWQSGGTTITYSNGTSANTGSTGTSSTSTGTTGSGGTSTGSTGSTGGTGGGTTNSLTDQLAGLKRQYEQIKTQNPNDPRLEQLHQQANQLRAQGASETQANQAVYANPCGAFGCAADSTTYRNQAPGQGGNVNLGGTSYYSSNGIAVAWAGGDNIVVFDRNGNPVYRGPGERRPDGRIIPPASVRDQIGFGVAPAYGIGSPTFFGTGGSETAGGRGGDRSLQSQSPFPNAPDYAGMQPVTLVLTDGTRLEGYANVYHDKDGLGYSAIPATSDLGKKLKDAGFQVDPGSNQVLIHNGAPGATVGWERATGAPGPSLTNLGTTCQWCTGGLISLRIGGNGSGAPGANGPGNNGGNAGNTVIFPPTIQWISLNPATVRFGAWLDVAVSTVGYADNVTMRVNHRRTDLPVDRFDYTLTRRSRASPGAQAWTARIRVDWITPEEFQYAMRQQDGSQEWLDLCRCSIDPYTISVLATGPGGSTPGQTDVIVQGTTIWVVPVPAGK